VKTYYDLLEVPPGAPADVIKRAFRREIAKYHPDKVQHLGREFQEIAASKAAALTQAYRTLIDAAARAEYDASIGGNSGLAAQRAAEAAAAQTPLPRATQFSPERHGASALMKRAVLARFQAALSAEFGEWQHASVNGFDLAAVPQPAFWSLKPPPRVLARVVEVVDGTAVADTWTLTSRMKKDAQRDVCVFLMGPRLAPAADLAVTIAEQRRKPAPGTARLVLVPLNTTDWSAHVPTDAPAPVKALLARLQSR
jgi:DnaJ-domain-containing protein 1